VGTTKLANTPGSALSKLPAAQPLIIHDPNNKQEVEKVLDYIHDQDRNPPRFHGRDRPLRRDFRYSHVCRRARGGNHHRVGQDRLASGGNLDCRERASAPWLGAEGAVNVF